MLLHVRRLRQRPEIERLNHHAVLERRRWLKVDIARELKVPLDHSIVDMIYAAIMKGVKHLKTKNLDLLTRADVINDKFGVRITNAT